MSLYEQIGGDDSIAAAVEAFYSKVVVDERLAPWFAGIDLDQLKAHQRSFLMVGLGGPEEYEGRSMRNAHLGLEITHDAYTAAIADLAEALADLGLTPELVHEVTRRFEGLRAAIVEVR